MKLRISVFALMLVMLFAANNTQAQKIEDLLAKYTDANGEKFMQPWPMFLEQM